MADIELVIKIDNQTYNNFVNNEYSRNDVIAMHTALVNGTPLPKGHGRIGDLDALREEVSYWGMNDYEPSDFIDAIDQADTIIESDKGENK